jgi:nicotinamide mononucleotide transporter
MTEALNLLIENFYQTTWVEGIAVAFGLVSVWYASRNSVLVFPTGIVNVLLYVYICQQYGLYADMGVQVFYFGMSIYGWYSWTHQNGKKGDRPISRTTLKEKIIMIVSLVGFFLIIRYILLNYTDSVVPNIDAVTTSIFLVGMWLMAIRKIENWTLWITGDIISIPLYYYKDLALTSLQYAVFLIIAMHGYRNWSKQLK